MVIGTFTGGGPAPGLNTALYTLAQEANKQNCFLLGFKEGAKGLLDKDFAVVSSKADIAGDWYLRGGTIIGTSRTSLEGKEKKKRLRNVIDELGIEAFITIGGDDTAQSALLLNGLIPTNHVPKTIDNDVEGTDRTFGIDTFVSKAREAANALAIDARSNHRLYFSEVMGRDNGTLTFEIFLGSMAMAALIPEQPFDLGKLLYYLEHQKQAFGLILVAEGSQDIKMAERYTQEREMLRALLEKENVSKDLLSKHFPVPERDEFGNVKKGGIVQMLVDELKVKIKKIKVQRVPDLGYQYRCAAPVPADVVLASRLARHAITALLSGENGIMAALQRQDIVSVPLEAVVGKKRFLAKNLYQPYLIDGGILVK